MMFFSLFSTALSSVFYGALATVVLMALLYVILMIIDNRKVRTPAFFITGVVLALLLIAQFSMLFGALEVKSTVDSVKELATLATENVDNAIKGVVADGHVDAVTDKYPIIGTYMDICGSGVESTGLSALAFVEMVQDTIASYIWRRVGWIAAFTVVAFSTVLLVPGRGRQKYTSAYDSECSVVGDTNEWGI